MFSLTIMQPLVQFCHYARRHAFPRVQHKCQRVAGQVGQSGVTLAHGQVQDRLTGGKIAEQLARHLVVAGVAQAHQNIRAVFQCVGVGGREHPRAHKSCAHFVRQLGGIGGEPLPAAACHRQGHVCAGQGAEQCRRKVRLPQFRVQAAAENAPHIVVFFRAALPRQQRREAQHMGLSAPVRQRAIVGIVGHGLRRDEGPIQCVQQPALPCKAARGRVVPVAGVGV